MLPKKDNRATAKDSNSGSSSKLLQALQKMLANGGGSVAYVFVSNRYDRQGNAIQIKSTQHVNISAQALEGQKPGVQKSPEELAHMFHTNKWDLGADYFIVD